METKAIWHGDDKAAAIERAKSINGQVVYSWAADADRKGTWGYWSEPMDGGGMMRLGERVEWPRSRR